MSSATGFGCQEPTWSWCAPYERSQGGYAVELANAYGIPPHEWQRRVLADWLALAPDGTLLNSTCILPVPRQNGKTGVCDPRETFGLIVRHERILHTAQEFQTAKVGFDRLREKFGKEKNDPNARFPELNALVERYTTSANQMILDLKTGGHIEFRTRGSGGDVGRGGTFDLVVVDEAQAYTEEQDASLSPLNSASPLGSPQTILMGTVPDPANAHKGFVFTNQRNQVRNAPLPGFCLHEWSADEVGDVMDRSRWYRTNPSLGHQLLERALAKDAYGMRPETFAREHLGWWPPNVASMTVISPHDWNACRTDSPPASGRLAVGVRFSPDGEVGCVAACLVPAEGAPYVEVVEHWSMSGGVRRFADLLCEMGDVECLAVDGRSHSDNLRRMLRERGFPERATVSPTVGEVVTANSMLLNAVRERRVSHMGQPALNDSATRCGRRPIGSDGGWGFKGGPEVDPSLVEACALAHWAACTRTKPKRKARIG